MLLWLLSSLPRAGRQVVAPLPSPRAGTMNNLSILPGPSWTQPLPQTSEVKLPATRVGKATNCMGTSRPKSGK